jgi:hypothetical protein
MPIKLIPPREGFSPNYYGRGTYLGIFVDRSTGTDRKPVAKKVVAKWERDIERGCFQTGNEPTFLAAATAYMRGNSRNDRPLKKLIQHAPLAELPLSQVRQAAIDAAAAALFPEGAEATRNREVYTPVSAVLKHAGIDFRIRRPKGSRGRVLTGWLWPEEAERLLAEAVKIDTEFGLLCVFLLCTGVRLSEGTLWLTCSNLRLASPSPSSRARRMASRGRCSCRRSLWQRWRTIRVGSTAGQSGCSASTRAAGSTACSTRPRRPLAWRSRIGRPSTSSGTPTAPGCGATPAATRRGW